MKNRPSATTLEQTTIDNVAESHSMNHSFREKPDVTEKAASAKFLFLKSLEHDLFNQLNSIIGFSHTLKNSEDLTKKDQRNVDIIHRAGIQMQSLIKDALELLKLESGRVPLNLETINLQELLTDIASNFGQRAQQGGLDFQIISDDFPANLIFDGGKLKTILYHLLDNAFACTPAGEVTLTIHVSRTADGIVDLSFTVSDSGFGIPAEQQQAIFQAFVKLDNPGKRSGGSGLGLTICQQYLSLMGQQLSVESSPGVGTSFRFNLVAPIDKYLSHLATQGSADLTSSKKKILIVDSAPESRFLIRSLIEMMGYTVAEAKDSHETFKQLIDFHPDLILIDWLMPQLNGLDASIRIRQMTEIQQPAIIMMSGDATNEDKATAVNAGASDFLPKPVDEKNLYKILKKYLETSVITTQITNAPILSEMQNTKQVLAQEVANIPAPLKNSLYQAVRELDQTEFLQLLMQLKEVQPALSQQLQSMAEEFRFQELWQLFEGIAK